MGDDGREAVRHAITAQVKMRRRMEHSVASSVSDLSLSGFRLRAHMKLAAGCEIALTLPGLEARWAKKSSGFGGSRQDAAFMSPCTRRSWTISSGGP